MPSHASLDAAAQERKARLAKLKSLKRKQPDTNAEVSTEAIPATVEAPATISSPTPPDITATYLSGRNYNALTKGPKLGFELPPSVAQPTLEAAAARLAAETRAQAEADAATDAPLDLFKLQPKKPNWDLKRDLARKLEVLDVRTENAIARLVRRRIEGARKVDGGGGGKGQEGGDGEVVGMEGATLVEAMHVREREEEEDRRREEEDEDL
ncbi:hypothetical protein LTR39_003538 [Cryomyces antarcticus]|nr:hypothetical protein LTR39_003538 [Cryomyces antarcticus]